MFQLVLLCSYRPQHNHARTHLFCLVFRSYARLWFVVCPRSLKLYTNGFPHAHIVHLPHHRRLSPTIHTLPDKRRYAGTHLASPMNLILAYDAQAHCTFYILHAGNSLCGVWDHAQHVQDPEIHRLVRSLPQVVRSALATSTMDKYGRGWLRWRQWASSKPEVYAIPAKPWYVALYFNHLIQTNGTTGALHSAAYGIRWAHHTAGFPSPLDDPFVSLVLQGCERLCAQPTTKKDPSLCLLLKN